MEENNTNINDVFNKFNNILKEKNINLGDILGNNNNSNNNSSTDKNNTFDFDINTILKLKKIFEKINNNDNPITRLLYDLKPFFKDEKKEKIDEIIKIVKIIGIISMLNEETDFKEIGKQKN